jgi:putative DNA primase/helicase
MRVSCVKHAKDTATRDYNADEIIESIRTEKHFKLRQSVEDIRRTFGSVMTDTGSNRKAAKEAVSQAKQMLPGVLWSGRFRNRRSNDPDKLLQHSGLLCADLDELGDRIGEVRAHLLKSLHLWALFLSPTGDGLKCVFRVPADAQKHKASFRAVERHVHDLTGVQIDESCSDVSRLCFLSHDPDAHFNGNAVELPPLMETAKPTSTPATLTEPEIETRRVIAVELLGDIDWSTESRGCCACPGQHAHTTGNGEADCNVYLDKVPTIYCFHNHCQDILEVKNRELRSRVGKAEFAASGDNYPVNDTQRALRFAKEFAGELRYVQAWKKWLLWDGVRWAPDEDGAVFRKAQEMPKLFLQEASKIDDPDRRKKAAGAAIAAGDKRKIEAMISLAQCQIGIAASPTLFDSDPLLLGVCNGVVDLRTGTFREARREDYIIKQAGTAYDASATCPTWEKFLSRVLSENAELISFIQRAVGYSLTASIVEQVLFFLYGTGQNGKSTFAECLKHLFGGYMIKATTALYTLDRRGKEPETEIARLVGKRLVTGSETEEGARLAESRVKDITGGDTLTGRALYCPAFNFLPTHKLWIYGNHQPDVRGNDHGIWRRIKIVPFEVQIPEEEKDPELLKKLLEEMPGVLKWAIKGCLEWQKSGLRPPHVVVEATAEYRDGEDEIGEFLTQTCFQRGKVERTALCRRSNQNQPVAVDSKPATFLFV